MRDVALGRIQINQKIMSMLDCSYDQAELINFRRAIEQTVRRRVEADHLCGGDRLGDGNRRALDFFYTNYPDDPIKRIILSGGGANIAEFRQLLASESAAQVETLNPFNGSSLTKRVSTGVHPTNRPASRHRHGTGPQKSRRQMIRINLLQFRSARTKENIRRQLSISLLVAIMTLVSLFGVHLLLSSQIDDLNSRITTTTAELEKYDKINREIEEIKKKLDNLNKKMDVIRQLEANRDEPSGSREILTQAVIEADVVHPNGNQARGGRHQRYCHGRQDRGGFHGPAGRLRFVLYGQPQDLETGGSAEDRPQEF